jgi:hypothetical protein
MFFLKEPIFNLFDYFNYAMLYFSATHVDDAEWSDFKAPYSSTLRTFDATDYTSIGEDQLSSN